MKQTVFLAIAMMMSTGASADVPHGKQLHDERCMKCHDDSVYTRKDHFVTSKDELAKQVSRCASNTAAQWSDKDVADVVDYLNATYYMFD
jgi:mono/diheme cytochrome c family protein